MAHQFLPIAACLLTWSGTAFASASTATFYNPMPQAQASGHGSAGLFVVIGDDHLDQLVSEPMVTIAGLEAEVSLGHGWSAGLLAPVVMVSWPPHNDPPQVLAPVVAWAGHRFQWRHVSLSPWLGAGVGMEFVDYVFFAAIAAKPRAMAGASLEAGLPALWVDASSQLLAFSSDGLLPLSHTPRLAEVGISVGRPDRLVSARLGVASVLPSLTLRIQPSHSYFEAAAMLNPNWGMGLRAGCGVRF